MTKPILQFTLIVCVLSILGCGSPNGLPPTADKSNNKVDAPVAVRTHPVFRTSMTGIAQKRPAVFIDVRDQSEDVFFRAELYLSVQYSKFPGNTRILMPINVGDFAGCQKRFVQLPFEVDEGETIAFELLDNDRLTSEQEQILISGCKGCGFCIVVAGEYFCPGSSRITMPVSSIVSDILGEAIIADVKDHPFENFGTAEYIVPKTLPAQPKDANRLDIISNSNYAPASLRIYGPKTEQEFVYDDL